MSMILVMLLWRKGSQTGNIYVRAVVVQIGSTICLRTLHLVILATILPFSCRGYRSVGRSPTLVERCICCSSWAACLNSMKRPRALATTTWPARACCFAPRCHVSLLTCACRDWVCVWSLSFQLFQSAIWKPMLFNCKSRRSISLYSIIC